MIGTVNQSHLRFLGRVAHAFHRSRVFDQVKGYRGKREDLESKMTDMKEQASDNESRDRE